MTVVKVLAALLLILAAAASLMATSFPNACGDGRLDKILDDFDTIQWKYCCSSPGGAQPSDFVISQAAGCSGNAMSVAFNLTGHDWFVIWTENAFAASPLNLENTTHLRFAFKSSNPNAHHTLQFKLFDGNGLWTATLRSTADLPAWRPVYIDFREFTCDACGQPLNLAHIQRLEIGILRCDCEAAGAMPITNSDIATLYFDEIGAVDLRPGAPQRLTEVAFEVSPGGPDLRATTAAALRDQQRTDGFLPAWFEECRSDSVDLLCPKPGTAPDPVPPTAVPTDVSVRTAVRNPQARETRRNGLVQRFIKRFEGELRIPVQISLRSMGARDS